MATAFSRVELGVHWTTDVIASVFVTVWLTAIGIVLGGRLRPGRLADRTVVPEPLPGSDGTSRTQKWDPVDLTRCSHFRPAQNLASLPVALERPVNVQPDHSW